VKTPFFADWGISGVFPVPGARQLKYLQLPSDHLMDYFDFHTHILLKQYNRILGFVSHNDQLPTGVAQVSPYTADREYLSSAEWRALGISDVFV
jgi:hypothetical protein